MDHPSPPDDTDLGELAGRLGEALLAQGATVTVAESCTGGWIAKCLTDVPGSSGWFERGWVSYSNAAKREDLGVAPSLLASEGAVSEAVVRAMADGARRRAGATAALAVSGIAGPGGGSEAKPVGTVCFGLARADGRTEAWTCRFAGDRDAVRRAAVAEGLRLMAPDHHLSTSKGE